MFLDTGGTRDSEPAGQGPEKTTPPMMYWPG